MSYHKRLHHTINKKISVQLTTYYIKSTNARAHAHKQSDRDYHSGERGEGCNVRFTYFDFALFTHKKDIDAHINNQIESTLGSKRERERERERPFCKTFTYLNNQSVVNLIDRDKGRVSQTESKMSS